jgi:hypothetical protein
MLSDAAVRRRAERQECKRQQERRATCYFRRKARAGEKRKLVLAEASVRALGTLTGENVEVTIKQRGGKSGWQVNYDAQTQTVTCQRYIHPNLWHRR